MALDPISKLVDSNGNWQVFFKYNNYGDNFLLLLPNFDNDGELDKNVALNHLTEGCYEEVSLIDSFLRSNPETPFIVQGKTIMDCVNTMNQRLIDSDALEEMMNPESKFYKEWDDFDAFQTACMKVAFSDDDKPMYKGCYGEKGWRGLLED